jgi:hypothetical protein
MKYRVLVAAIAAVLLAVLATACGNGGGPTWTKRTLTFSERQNDDSFSFADNPPASPAAKGDEPRLSNGDQITFTADMIDGSGKDVGDLDVTCTVTATETGSFDDSRAQCLGTADIPGGTLTLTVGGKAFGAGTTRGANRRRDGRLHGRGRQLHIVRRERHQQAVPGHVPAPHPHAVTQRRTRC